MTFNKKHPNRGESRSIQVFLSMGKKGIFQGVCAGDGLGRDNVLRSPRLPSDRRSVGSGRSAAQCPQPSPPMPCTENRLSANRMLPMGFRTRERKECPSLAPSLQALDCFTFFHLKGASCRTIAPEKMGEDERSCFSRSLTPA